MGGVPSSEEQLIPFFRDMMFDLNEYRHDQDMVPMLYLLENVASSGHMMKKSMVTDGQQVGSRVNRKRLFESNFDLRCELSHSLKLCLGDRAKWARSDKNVIRRIMKESGAPISATPDLHAAGALRGQPSAHRLFTPVIDGSGLGP